MAYTNTLAFLAVLIFGAHSATTTSTQEKRTIELCQDKRPNRRMIPLPHNNQDIKSLLHSTAKEVEERRKSKSNDESTVDNILGIKI